MKKEWIEAQRMLQKCVDNLKSIEEKRGTKEYEDAVEAVRTATGVANEKKLLYEASRAAAEQADDEELEKKAAKFSIAKFLREARSGNLTGLEAEMAEVAKKEAADNGISLKGHGIPSVVLRAFGGNSATGTGAGAELVGSTMTYQEALRSKLVLVQAGAQYLSGLRGDIDLITGNTIESGWAGENETVGGDTKKTFTKKTFKPKRNYINVPISIQLIEQASFDVERMIMDDILNAHAALIDKAAICGSGSDNEPTGILNTVGIGSVVMGTNGAAATFRSMVDLETAVAVQNADIGSLAYVTNAKVRGALKTTLKAEGVSGYVWEKSEVNGYKAYATNLVPSKLTKGTSNDCSAAIFGNFSDLMIGSWGGLDILVDPYTSKKAGAIELTLNAYNDIMVKRAESFAAIKDIKA